MKKRMRHDVTELVPMKALRSGANQRLRRCWGVSVAIHFVLLIALACLTFAGSHIDSLHLSLDFEADTSPNLAPVMAMTESLEMEAPEFDQELPDVPRFTLAEVSDVVLPQFELPLSDREKKSARRPGSPTRGSGARRGNRGRRSREPATEFFGLRQDAQRVVYLVDNSNSMHSGRFETALMELQQSVARLAGDQQFYVAFYSDQVYGLFYPDTAEAMCTADAATKERFQKWLSTVEMCVGGKLLDAFRLAESLEPHTIYLLSDGVITSQRTLDYLLESHGRPFVVHTVGLTIPNPTAGRRLQAIAATHGGTTQFVGVSRIAYELARRNPIRRNRHRGSVWGASLPLPSRF